MIDSKTAAKVSLFVNELFFAVTYSIKEDIWCMSCCSDTLLARKYIYASIRDNITTRLTRL